MKRLFFNLWYLRKPPWDTGISPPELLEFIRQHPPGRALDLGCGTGTNALTLAKAGWQVTGVDFASQAISRARRGARHAGVMVTFLTGDVSAPAELSGPFDFILDVGCFHALTPKQKLGYIQNLIHWLAPGAHFLLYAFTTGGDRGNPGLSPADLASLESRLLLVWRKDGQERGLRPSAWFEFIKQSGEAARG